MSLQLGDEGVHVGAVAHADPAGEANSIRTGPVDLDDRAAGQPLAGVTGADPGAGDYLKWDPERFFGQQAVEGEGVGFEPVVAVATHEEAFRAVALPPFAVDFRANILSFLPFRFHHRAPQCLVTR